MRRIDPAGCLDLNHDLGVDDEIGDIPANHLAAKHDLERYLPLDSVAPRAQHDRDRVRIDSLEEPISELAMHLVQRPDDRS